LQSSNNDAEKLPNSSRVLNLFELSTQRAQLIDGRDEENKADLDTIQHHVKGAFFLNPILNKAVIIKHRLNQDQRKSMADPDSFMGTKIFVRYGFDNSRDNSGKYMYLGERGSDAILQEHFGLGRNSGSAEQIERDLNLLSIIDKLPSLDPFLLRERLIREGLGIDDHYFRMSSNETQKIKDDIIREFQPLVKVAFDERDDTKRLTQLIINKMWLATDMSVLGPLLKALELEPENASEVFFAWKGFVYYKLLMRRLSGNFATFLVSLENVQPVSIPTAKAGDEINMLRPRIVSSLKQEYDLATAQIEMYNHAYRHEMIRLSRPRQFTQFLGRAGYQFERLGASVVGIEHAQTTWRRRFGMSKTVLVSANDLLEMLRDFDDGLPT